MKFSLTALLWLTSLIALGMGTFGAVAGLLLAGLVCVAQVVPWRRPTCLECVLAAAVFVVGAAILLPTSWGYPLAAARRSQSMHQMRQLALGMIIYEDNNNRFPPAYSIDSDGKPLHSWRTLVLPFVDYGSLYDGINLDEPWDSPANSTLLSGLQLELFKSPPDHSPSSLPDATDYFVVADDEAVFRPGKGVSVRDITDGLSRTIVLIEVHGRGVRWHEPRDLTMEEAIDVLTGQGEDDEYVNPGFFVSTRYHGGYRLRRNVVFADGHTEWLGRVIDREVARALLTRAGGETIPPEYELDSSGPGEVVGHIVHWRRVVSLLLFVGLAVGPFFRRAGTRVGLNGEEPLASKPIVGGLSEPDCGSHRRTKSASERPPTTNTHGGEA